MRAAALAAILVFAALSAVAETSPYHGLESRSIKALSEQEMADLRAGKGMAMALAAELNGYPGPRHVLDLAGPLALTPGQSTAIQSLFEAMQAEATTLGQAVIAAESDLEQQFRSATLDDDGLQARVMSIAGLRGQLRLVHLRYHLATRAVLDRHQLALYGSLRGYDSRNPAHGHRH